MSETFDVVDSSNIANESTCLEPDIHHPEIPIEQASLEKFK